MHFNSVITMYFVPNCLIVVALYSSVSAYGHFGNDRFDPFSSLNSMGSSISAYMKEMETKIKTQMDTAMKPMKVHMKKQSMANGVGGTTIIITRLGEVIVRNNRWYRCSGRVIDGPQPRCSGRVQAFDRTQTPCFTSNYMTSGNYLCISPNGNNGRIQFSNINGKVSCDTGTGKKGLYTFQEFANFCGGLPWEYEYNYYPENSDPMRVDFSDIGCQYGYSCNFKMDFNGGFNGRVNIQQNGPNGGYSAQQNNGGYSMQNYYSYP